MQKYIISLLLFSSLSLFSAEEEENTTPRSRRMFSNLMLKLRILKKRRGKEFSKQRSNLEKVSKIMKETAEEGHLKQILRLQTELAPDKHTILEAAGRIGLDLRIKDALELNPTELPKESLHEILQYLNKAASFIQKEQVHFAHQSVSIGYYKEPMPYVDTEKLHAALASGQKMEPSFTSFTEPDITPTKEDAGKTLKKRRGTPHKIKLG